MNKIARYRGEPIESLTKNELIIALNIMAEYYETCLADKDKIIELFQGEIKCKKKQ